MFVLERRRCIQFAFLAAAMLTCRQSAAQLIDPERGSLDAEFWASVDTADVIVPCEPGSEDAERAAEAIRELDERIEGLELSDDHEPSAKSILGLLRTTCFHMAREIDRLPRPDSAESLIRWWKDGGSSWLYSYVELPKLMNGRRPHIVIPPDDRSTLLPRTRTGWRLGPLLCEEADEDCRAETAGWRLRAESSIEVQPENRRIEQSFGTWSWRTHRPRDVTAQAIQEVCVEKALELQDYLSFRRCAGSLVVRRASLPWGAIRAPKSGWLVVAGRRGHYEYCDEVNAYNLGNGDAFRASHCSGLVLQQGGHIDVAATERRASEQVETGRVNVENLRETAWMLLIAPQVEELRVRASFVELPGTVERRIPVSEVERDWDAVGGFSWSSAQTWLDWSINHPEYAADGELVWPSSDQPEEDYVARLLEIAESSWQAHCPEAPPSTSAIGRLYPTVNRHDADVDVFQETMQRLKRSIAEWTPDLCSDGDP